MTCKTSAVAVCCSKASRVSVRARILHRDHRLRRKFVQQGDLLFGDGRTSRRLAVMTPSSTFILAQRHDHERSEADLHGRRAVRRRPDAGQRVADIGDRTSGSPFDTLPNGLTGPGRKPSRITR